MLSSSFSIRRRGLVLGFFLLVSFISPGHLGMVVPEISYQPPPLTYLPARPPSNNITQSVAISILTPNCTARLVHRLYLTDNSLVNISGVYFTVKQPKGLSKETWIYPNIQDWTPYINKVLHWIVHNELGSVVSRPFRIVNQVLNSFPLVGDESINFYAGNVGRISCLLPRSRPSPPKVIFKHNSKTVNTSDSRYKLIYISHKKATPEGEMVLLISSLKISDSGVYTCEANLGATFVVQSEKRTYITVKSATSKVPMTYRFSSDDPDSKYPIRVPEGSDVTLYCIFESAPVQEVSWYNVIKKQHVTVEEAFGTLSFKGIQMADSKGYSCFPGEQTDLIKRFKIVVIKRISITVKPMDTLITKLGESHSLSCEVGFDANDPPVFPKWFFNGRTIDGSNDDKDFTITDVKLTIKNVTESRLGIYQCWATDIQHNWIADTATVMRKSDKVIKIDSPTTPSERTVIRGQEGLVQYLRCVYPASTTTLPVMHVKWFKGEVDPEPLKTSFIKYHLIKGTEDVTLTILNPNKGDKDNGFYTCRIYDNKTRTLIAERHFEFIIESATSDPFPNPELNKPKVPVVPLPTPAPTNPPKEYFPVSTPLTTPLADFLLAVQLEWTLLNKTVGPISHYRIESRTRTGSTGIRVRRSIDKETQWGQVEMLADTVKGTRFLIDGSQNLMPGNVYSFRILGVPEQGSSSQVVSPWSAPVSFEHLMPEKVEISSVKPLSSTKLQVIWVPFDPPVSLFRVLYRTVGSQLASSRDPTFWTATNQVRQKEVLSENTQTDLMDLEPGTTYAIAIYAVKQDGGKTMYALLSEEVKETTKTQSSLNDAQDKIAEKPLSPNTGRNADSKSRADDGRERGTDDRSTRIREQEEALENEAKRHRLLFLILGSLSGILFVIAAVLLTMCICHKIRRRHKHRNRSPMPYASPIHATTTAPHPYSRDPATLQAAAPWTGTLQRRNGAPLPPPHQYPLPASHPYPQQDLYRYSPETMALMPDRRHPTLQHPHMNPISMDQASSIYSQVDSEMRYSNNQLNMVGRGRMENNSPTLQDNMFLPDEADHEMLRTLPPPYPIPGSMAGPYGDPSFLPPAYQHYPPSTQFYTPGVMYPTHGYSASGYPTPKVTSMRPLNQLLMGTTDRGMDVDSVHSYGSHMDGQGVTNDSGVDLRGFTHRGPQHTPSHHPVPPSPRTGTNRASRDTKGTRDRKAKTGHHKSSHRTRSASRRAPEEGESGDEMGPDLVFNMPPPPSEMPVDNDPNIPTQRTKTPQSDITTSHKSSSSGGSHSNNNTGTGKRSRHSSSNSSGINHGLPKSASNQNIPKVDQENNTRVGVNGTESGRGPSLFT